MPTPPKKEASKETIDLKDIEATAKKLQRSPRALKSFLKENRYLSLVTLSRIMKQNPGSAQHAQVVLKSLEMFLELSAALEVALDRKGIEKTNARLERGKNARSESAPGCGDGQAGG